MVNALAAIVTFDGSSPIEPLVGMLEWARPAFANGQAGELKTHQFSNAAFGATLPENFACDPSGMVWVVFTGQLFRKPHKEVPDTFHVLDTYMKKGTEGFSELDGEFSFLILDQSQKVLYAVRDRLGIFPLYWYIDSNLAFLSTSLKSILSTGYVSPTPDLMGVASTLCQGFISQDATCIASINRLLSGYYLKLSLDGPFKIASFWSFSSKFATHYATEFDSSLEIYCELDRHINEAIAIRDKLDAACISHQLGSYIIWQTLREKEPSRNLPLIHQELSSKNFLDSLVPMVWAMELPNAEPAASYNWYYMKRCQQESLIPFYDTGFAQEMYDYSKEVVPKPHYNPPWWIRLASHFSQVFRLNQLRKSFEETPQGAFLESKFLISPNEFEISAPELSSHFDVNIFVHQFYHLPRIPKLDASLFYLTMKSSVSDGRADCLNKLAHSHGLMAQNPFMDYHLLEFFASFPPEVWASPDLLAAFPQYWLQAHDIQPDIASWPKISPLPVHLLQDPLVWKWFQRLESASLVKSGFIHASWVKKALQAPQKYLHILYAMLIIEIWMRLFIDLPLKESNKDLTLEDLFS